MKSQIIKTLLVPFIGIVAGIFLMFGAYAIPNHLITTNVERSIAVFEKESTWEEAIPGVPATTIDNFTDARFIGVACYDSSQRLLKRTLSNMYPETLSDGEGEPDEALVEYVKGGEIEASSYCHFWNGHVVLLKPLLLFFSLQEIRVINFFLITLLMFILVILGKRHGPFFQIALCILFISVSPSTIASTISYATAFYIALIASIIIILFGRRIQNAHLWAVLFSAIGTTTIFFNYLNFTTLTLTIPLLVSCYEFTHSDHFDCVAHCISCCVSWLVGLCLMWFGKWILNALVLHHELLPVGKLLQRSSSVSADGHTITFVETLQRNFSAWPEVFYCLIVGFMLGCFIIMIKKQKPSIKDANYGVLASLVLIMLIPFAWVLVAQNYSFIHYWMNYRIFACIPFGFFVLIQLVFMKSDRAASSNAAHAVSKDVGAR